MLSEFGEPWKISNDTESIDNADGNAVLFESNHDRRCAGDGPNSPDDPEQIAWKRIIACVNFCRNIPSEFLEKTAADWPFEQINGRLFYITVSPPVEIIW